MASQPSPFDTDFMHIQSAHTMYYIMQNSNKICIVSITKEKEECCIEYNGGSNTGRLAGKAIYVN
jgi:hypothetical protein